MKKGIIVLLIAVLVSGFAFAKLTGDAGVRFDADFDAKGFGTSNTESLTFSFEFASEKVEIAGDEDVHVEVAASGKFILGKLKTDAGNGIYIQNSTDATRGIGAVISLDTAKIVGKNWYVDVTGTQSAYDYAKAAVLTISKKSVKDDFGNKWDYDDAAASYVVTYENLPGVTVGFNGFTASAGVEYIKDFAFMTTAAVETPEFAFNEDAIKVQGAAEFGRFKLGDAGDYIAITTFGASAKTTAAIQDITVGAAVDMGVEYLGAEVAQIGISETDTQFNIDARVDFKYNFVDASIYTYAGKEGLEYGKWGGTYRDFYLEAKAAFDLNAFELPLKVTVSAKNITNSDDFVGGAQMKAGIEPAIKVEYAKDAVKAVASFGMNTEYKNWDALVYGTYAFEKFTAGAGVYVWGLEEVGIVQFGAFAESDKIVNGAKFGLGYGLNGGKLYAKGGEYCLDNELFTNNFKADPVNAGTMTAYCKIAF